MNHPNTKHVLVLCLTAVVAAACADAEPAAQEASPISGDTATRQAAATTARATMEGAAAAVDDDKAEVLDDVILGDPNAPITIIEYGSLGCSACYEFHTTTFPTIKDEYIDTGHVNFIFREFRAGESTLFTAGSLFTRCVSSEHYYEALDIAFKNIFDLYQGLQTRTLGEAYIKVLDDNPELNLTPDQFFACQGDQALLDRVNATSDHGASEWGVRSTPTFFFNGARLLPPGRRDVEALRNVLDELIGE